MRAWLGRVGKSLGERDRLLEQKNQAIEAQERMLAGAEPILAALAAELGLAPIDGLDVALLADRVERRIEEVAGDFEAHRALETRLAEAQWRIDGATSDEAEAAAALRDWRARGPTPRSSPPVFPLAPRSKRARPRSTSGTRR